MQTSIVTTVCVLGGRALALGPLRSTAMFPPQRQHVWGGKDPGQLRWSSVAGAITTGKDGVCLMTMIRRSHEPRAGSPSVTSGCTHPPASQRHVAQADLDSSIMQHCSPAASVCQGRERPADYRQVQGLRLSVQGLIRWKHVTCMSSRGRPVCSRRPGMVSPALLSGAWQGYWKT